MKVQRLRIEQQLAQIRVDSQMASLSIEMPRRTMSVEQLRPQMSVSRQEGKIRLDMEEFRDNIGLKSIRALTAETAARAQAKVEQSIKEIAGDGDYIGTLPASGNPIAEVARRKMLESRAKETGGETVPDGAVKMEGIPGGLQINWSKHDLKINWDNFQSPVITVEPKASVNVQIVREPHIEYTVVELTIPAETGRAIDEEV